jgi:hypothetical protein
VDHWECNGCKALTSPTLDECWNCGAPKGSLPTLDAAAAGKSARQAAERTSNPRLWSLVLGQSFLQVIAAVASVILIKAVYCSIAYKYGCPYRSPDVTLIFLALLPFLVVAVDVASIYLVAPSSVSREVAEAVLHRGRPSFLRQWYSKLLVKSYSRT